MKVPWHLMTRTKMKISIITFFLFQLGIQPNFAKDIFVPLGKGNVRFEVIESPVRGPGPLFISLHSNELNSVAAARQSIRSHAGTLILIDAGGKRRLSFDSGKSIDPNRVFSNKGVARDLNRFGSYTPAAEKAATAFGSGVIRKLKISKGRPVIALHNNTNGGYSIISYEAGGSESAATAEVFHSPQRDPDNFFLVTEERLYQALKEAGYNVVLQNNRAAPDDGSLSVYCGKKGITYINVETESGDSKTSRIMLEVLLQKLGSRK